jgi:hypothetical protein
MRCVKTLSLLAAMAAITVMAVGCERTITTVEQVHTAEACFDCHSDTDLKLVSAEAQWQNSHHASGENIDRSGSSCRKCHTSEGFLNVVAGIPVPSPFTNPTAIHCFTCHAPHTTSTLALRVTTPQTLQDGASFDLGGANICSACHQARRNVNTYVANPTTLSEHWGPHHSPQADMLLAANGYEYPTFMYEDTQHRGATSDGCLDCHFKTTSNYVVGGHSFNMEWHETGDTLRNTDACEPCHGSLDDFNHNDVQDSTSMWLAQLEAALQAAGLLDGSGHPIDDVVTSADSAGAVWNYLIVEEDRSHGVHNHKYTEGLLKSSMQFMAGTLAPRYPPMTAHQWARRPE